MQLTASTTLLLVLFGFSSLDSTMSIGDQQQPQQQELMQQRQQRQLSWADKTAAGYIPADTVVAGTKDDNDDDSVSTNKAPVASSSDANATIKESAEASYAYMHQKQTSANETVQVPWNYTVDIASLNNSTTSLLPKEPEQPQYWPLYVSVGFGALAIAFGVGACLQVYRSNKRRHYENIPSDLIV